MEGKKEPVAIPAVSGPLLPPVPVNSTDLCLPACDPCVPACDPSCPPKPAKVKKECAAPAKIIVHQAQPIVEFRCDGPANNGEGARKVIEDKAVRTVGDFFHGNNCGCGGNAGNTPPHIHNKTKNYYCGGAGGYGAGAMAAPMTTTAYAQVPITMQAYVPQTLQTFAVAPVGMSSFGFAPAGVTSFGAPPVGGFGATAADLATARALADIFSAASVAPQNGTRSQAAAANVQTASAASVTSLEQKVQEIDTRLQRVERKLNALCNTP